MKKETAITPQAELDKIYDALSLLVDCTPKEEREKVLARLAVALIQELGAPERARNAIDLAAQK